MTFHGEVAFAKRYDFGCDSCFAPSLLTKVGWGGEDKQVTPKIVPFSASVLAVVTNKVEPTHKQGSCSRDVCTLWSTGSALFCLSQAL